MNLDEAANEISSTVVLPTIRPASSALILIHWQRDVVSTDGTMHRHFSRAVQERDVVARTRVLLGGIRTAGIQVVYANIVFDPNGSDIVANGPVFAVARASGSCRRGSVGAEVIPELSPAPGDYQVEHTRSSVFADTSLDAWLRLRQINTLLFSGVATNVAVESTARAAVDAGYWTVLVEDCCMGATPTIHTASVDSQRSLVSEVATQDQVLAALRAARRQPQGSP